MENTDYIIQKCNLNIKDGLKRNGWNRDTRNHMKLYESNRASTRLANANVDYI